MHSAESVDRGRGVKVGCCGFAVKGGKTAYFKQFDLVELQSTFYKLPKLSTAERWRFEAPESFVFTMKAFQVVTHPWGSPTWQKARLSVDPDKAARYGLLRPTDENLSAWTQTATLAKALHAPVVVVQSPPSFTFSDEAAKNMTEFFSTAERGTFQVAWEPRHPSWTAEKTRSLCRKLNLAHVVDPLREAAVSNDSLTYYRLHGLGERLYNYRYTDSDLTKLQDLAVGLMSTGQEAPRDVYLLWNNISMAEDAFRFKKLLRRS